MLVTEFAMMLALSMDFRFRVFSAFETINKPCIVKLTSSYRDPEHNHAVGGVEKSQHIEDLAFDIVTSCDRKDVVNRLNQQGLSVILYNSHIHVDTVKRNWGCLKYEKGQYKMCFVGEKS